MPYGGEVDVLITKGQDKRIGCSKSVVDSV